MTPRAMPRRLATLTGPRLPLLALILAATDMALGLVYILEPRDRTLSPAYAAAKEFMPLWAWGVVIAVIGLLAVIAVAWEFHPTNTMSIGAGWHCFFTLGLAWSAWHDNRAGLAGCVVYSSFTVLHLLAARKQR